VKVTILGLVLLLTGIGWGQTTPKPYSREAADKSFRALVAARDKEIIDLVKGDGLVCFADSYPIDEEDRFITLSLSKPGSWFEDKTSSVPRDENASIYDGKSELPAYSPGFLSLREWENQDSSIVISSGMNGKWTSYGHYDVKNGKREWKPFGNTLPTFYYREDKDEITGATELSALEDETTFYATKTFPNKSNGTTAHEFNLRLSTGRYKETWTPDKGDAFSSVGNCYKAKEYTVTPPAKKAIPEKKVTGVRSSFHD